MLCKIILLCSKYVTLFYDYDHIPYLVIELLPISDSPGKRRGMRRRRTAVPRTPRPHAT